MLETPQPCIERLAHVVDDLAGEEIDDLADAALGTDLVSLRRVIDRIEAEFIRRLERFDTQHGALAEGAVSTVSWLRSTCGLTGGAAADRVRMARRLADLPATTASFRAGRAGFANVSLIARLADEVGTDATRTVEATLVTAAEALDAVRMHYLTAFTHHRLDADGALAQDNRHHDHRWFSCDQTFGGVFVLRGELDAENGAVVKTALAALSAPGGAEDQRSGSQRRADALVELASRQLQNGTLPAVHGQRPHISVTADIATLRRIPGARPADLEGVRPVHAQTARRIACDSVLTLATVAGNGEPLSIGLAVAPFRRRFARRSTSATTVVASPDAIERRSGQMVTTSAIGRTAAKPASTTSCRCAGAITVWCMNAAGRSASGRIARSRSPNHGDAHPLREVGVGYGRGV